MNKVFNVSCRKVGGITFLKVGRFNVSFSVSKSYKPIGEKYSPIEFDEFEVRDPVMCSGPFWDELEAMAAELRKDNCGEAARER